MDVAFAYSRFSTPQQSFGDSLARQQSKAQAWAQQNGCDLQYLHDAGISAWKGDNATVGQLATFLTSLRAGELGRSPVLLIENFDRLSRQAIEEAQSLFLELVNKGARIVTLHNGKEYKRPLALLDIITALIEMDLANQESRKKSERVRAAYDSRRAAGKIMHTSANTPRWLRLINRERFEPITERVAVLQEIFRLAASGLGQFRLSRLLNKRGIKPWGNSRSSTRIWHASNLQKLIQSKMVLGHFRDRKNYFPQVIDTQLWQAANDRIVSRGASRGLSHDEANLLRGLAFSGLDGSAMVHRRGPAATPETRKAYNRIAYLRTRVKTAKGRRLKELEAELEAALLARTSMHENRRAAGRPGYSYRYERLASMATISGGAQISHWVSYKEVEQRLLWIVRSIAPEILSTRQTTAEDARQTELTEARQALMATERKVRRFAKLIAGDEEPSPSLVQMLKAAERDGRAAKLRLEQAEFAAARPTHVPTVTDEDLKTPEGRRGIRAQLARWLDRVEIGRDYLTAWLPVGIGIRVQLTGDLNCEVVTGRGKPVIEENDYTRMRDAEALLSPVVGD